MKKLLPVVLIICLYSCNMPVTEGMNENVVISAQTAASVIQTATDHDFADFERTFMKTEPDRAKPVFERAVKAREYSVAITAKLEELKLKFLVDKVKDVKSAGDEVFKEVDDANQKIMALLDDNELPRYKARLSSAIYRDHFNKDNAVTTLTLICTDVKSAEYNAVDVILRHRSGDQQ